MLADIGSLEPTLGRLGALAKRTSHAGLQKTIFGIVDRFLELEARLERLEEMDDYFRGVVGPSDRRKALH